MNPILLEVLWNRLLSVANEQQLALMRTAFSTIVRESQDLACAVFDSRALMIAQSLTGTPGHINPMATGAKHFIEAYPPETLKEGDVLITNDPWMTSGQINDLTVMTPVFKQGKIVAYFANCCHAADIGGHILSAETQDIFEEGLRIPITKLFHEGKPNEELFKIIRANVRTPEETIGDLYAQTACNDVGKRSLLQMMIEFDLDSIDSLADEIIHRSEKAMRDAIEKIPNGVYKNETYSDGFEEPLKLAVTINIKDRDIDIDFAGSSQQSKRGINVVLNYTKGYASFAMKAAISPEVPHNEGAFRPVNITAPEGSILNCKEGAAVASRHLVGHFIPSLILGALAPALPQGVVAGSADPGWMTIWRGTFNNGQASNSTLFQMGGMGARPNKDGLSSTGFPSGVAGVPAEVFEILTPIVQTKRELRTDSGGAGEFRGGLGQESEMNYRGQGNWSLSAMIDRTEFAAPGLNGGQSGGKGEFKVDGKKHPPKTVMWLESEQIVSLNPPGGGGFGNPLERDPEAVLNDVVHGYVSLEAAERLYGVLIVFAGEVSSLVRLPSDFELKREATKVLREKLKANLSSDLDIF